jgi:OOP family OmpA-OmpF porin
MKTSLPLIGLLLAVSVLSGCASTSARSGEDADGDGVADAGDRCPDTLAGLAVDAEGCPLPLPALDADGDGVADDQDRCPESVPGTLIDPQGCAAKIPPLPAAEIDSDGDGVLDGGDACPDTPAGMRTDGSGCVQATQTLVLRNIVFANGASELTSESQAILDRIVAGLRGQPRMQLQIVGHTDSVGAAGYNLRLSQARAAAVLDYLVAQGIDAQRLASDGAGETEPVADNATEEGRALNRRVEFRVE